MSTEDQLNTVTKKFNFNTNIVMWGAAVGIFVLLLPIPAGSIYAYGLIFFALLGLLILHLALQTRMSMETGILHILKKLLFASETLPILGLMTVLAWLFSLNIKYYARFNNPDMLPREFKTFKGVITGLLGIALLLVKTITSAENKESGAMKSKNPLAKFYKYASDSSVSILYLVITILGIGTGILQVMLEYYLTDG